MDREYMGAHNYTKRAENSQLEEKAGTMVGRTVNFEYNVRESDLINYTNHDLLTYIHYKKWRTVKIQILKS